MAEGGKEEPEPDLYACYFQDERLADAGEAIRPPPCLSPAVTCGRVPDAASRGIKEGRGIITTRAVKQGELLMLAYPLVSADVDKVFQAFRAQAAEASKPLEQLVDDELVAQLHALLAAAPTETRTLLASMAGGAQGAAEEKERPLPDLALLMKEPADLLQSIDDGDGGGGGHAAAGGGSDDEAWLRGILAANAHGPEFKLYPEIERDWRAVASSSPSSSPSDFLVHRRLGGLYPVPSLINHACVANACRVFLPVGGAMAVRATRDLAAGEEVLWPYATPLQPYAARQEALRAGFGFQCRCPRCELERTSGNEEGDAASSSYLALQARVAARARGPQAAEVVAALVEEVEAALQAVAPDPEQRRWCRASFLDLYFDLFNAPGALATQDEDARRRMERLRSELHWALLAVNNCSTEHLSLLHVNYETAGHHHGVNSKLSRFWIDQLTKAHLTRYGPVPRGDVGLLTRLLQHTRTVLRSRDGYRQVKHHFL